MYGPSVSQCSEFAMASRLHGYHAHFAIPKLVCFCAKTSESSAVHVSSIQSPRNDVCQNNVTDAVRTQ